MLLLPSTKAQCCAVRCLVLGYEEWNPHLTTLPQIVDPKPTDPHFDTVKITHLRLCNVPFELGVTGLGLYSRSLAALKA